VFLGLPRLGTDGVGCRTDGQPCVAGPFDALAVACPPCSDPESSLTSGAVIVIDDAGDAVCQHNLGTLWWDVTTVLSCPPLVHGRTYTASCVCTNGALQTARVTSGIVHADHLPPTCTVSATVPHALAFNYSRGDAPFEVEYSCTTVVGVPHCRLMLYGPAGDSIAAEDVPAAGTFASRNISRERWWLTQDRYRVVIEATSPAGVPSAVPVTVNAVRCVLTMTREPRRDTGHGQGGVGGWGAGARTCVHGPVVVMVGRLRSTPFSVCNCMPAVVPAVASIAAGAPYFGLLTAGLPTARPARCETYLRHRRVRRRHKVSVPKLPGRHFLGL
jgi:hypothetical protein